MTREFFGGDEQITDMIRGLCTYSTVDSEGTADFTRGDAYWNSYTTFLLARGGLNMLYGLTERIPFDSIAHPRTMHELFMVHRDGKCLYNSDAINESLSAADKASLQKLWAEYSWRVDCASISGREFRDWLE